MLLALIMIQAFARPLLSERRFMWAMLVIKILSWGAGGVISYIQRKAGQKGPP